MKFTYEENSTIKTLEESKDGCKCEPNLPYSYVEVFCYYRPNIASYPFRIQGVERSLRESQILYNRRKIAETDTDTASTEKHLSLEKKAPLT